MIFQVMKLICINGLYPVSEDPNQKVEWSYTAIFGNFISCWGGLFDAIAMPSAHFINRFSNSFIEKIIIIKQSIVCSYKKLLQLSLQIPCLRKFSNL